MITIPVSIVRMLATPAILCLLLSCAAWGQRPQDNWYLEDVWSKSGLPGNGGFDLAYGVAIGPDQRVYVGNEGAGQVSVYQPDGTFSFAITNGFGGESFSKPRGMITDPSGKLYVADSGRSCVYVFGTNGSPILKIGGTNGAGLGQLNGVIDVAVARSGEIYVLEQENCRVSVFNTNGTFIRAWGEIGALDGQLYRPTSIALSAGDRVYVCQPRDDLSASSAPLKVFDTHGKFLSKAELFFTSGYHPFLILRFGPSSVRVDPSGLIHVLVTTQNRGEPVPQDYRPKWVVLYPDLTTCFETLIAFDRFPEVFHHWPFHAVGPDGSVILCQQYQAQLWVYRRAMREQWARPRNALPMPTLIGKQQRPNSPLVDIDYRVTDADDSNVSTAILVFTNVSEVASLGNCLRNPTLVEGTSTNLGKGIAANQAHRLTWNAGADWSANLGQYRIAILAQDSRQELLDIHYLNLPPGNGLPALKISRSPLVASDFMQVWWWLLATNDVGIALSSNRIYGVAAPYSNKLLCDDGSTTPDGRSYAYGKMRLRQATSQELNWARQATMPAGTSPNQWSPGRIVAGRPATVNEYGFDTGNWDTNISFWVVPLN